MPGRLRSHGAPTLATRAVVIRCPHSRRILLRHLPQLQILWPIIVTLTVAVMHTLMRLQSAAELLFHDEAVLEYPLALVLDLDVSAAVSRPRSIGS